jgi:hypothetical protein
MQSSGQVFGIEEIIVNAPFLDKGTLRIGNKLVLEGTKPICNHLRHNLGNGMNQANGPVVGDPLRSFLLRHLENVCGV